MGKYILRRILQMIPVVLGTTLLIYALVFALPGDPVAAMFGDKPVNETVAAQIRAEYNLDKPFFVQYLLFLKNAITFNFGKTFAGQTVSSVISRAFPPTVLLAVMAFVFEALFGIVFGIISGLKKGKTEVAAFTDDAKIGSWAKNYVAYFVSHGVVNGMTDGSFAPAANMTREQAMKVAVEALDK